MKFLTILIALSVAAMLPPTPSLYGQTFHAEVLIDLPGDNYDFDIFAEEQFPDAEAYITWINQLDAIYTVYLKKISPVVGDVIILSSGIVGKSGPKIAAAGYTGGVRVAWQQRFGHYYQVVARDYIDNSIDDTYILLDSLGMDPQISINTSRIVWIDDGTLYLQSFDSLEDEPEVVDTGMCASPDIRKFDGPTYTSVVYEKGDDGARSIYLAEYNERVTPQWNIEILSDGENRNPVFGTIDGISFEKYKADVWQLVYSSFEMYQPDMTDNRNYDYRNPYVFSYHTPTKITDDETPFFVVFDTDSLGGSDVFIKSFYYNHPDYDTLIHISDMGGNHYKPKAGWIARNDTSYAVVIWHREYNSKIDIWMAKTVFNPIWSSVDEAHFPAYTFRLLQNYPNPFNPSTTIRFAIPERSHVTLIVYDMLGRHIAMLVDDFLNPGAYSHVFDAGHLASGVYLYRLYARDHIETKRLTLLR
jgi:hypothetical protein